MLCREDIIDIIMTILVRDLISFTNNLLQAFLIVGRGSETGKRTSRDGSREGGGGGGASPYFMAKLKSAG